MRLKSGQVNKNMLREVSLQVLVEEVSLNVDSGEVMMQDGHWLGYEIEGAGQEGAGRVVWEAGSGQKCKKAVLAKMKLTSKDGADHYNHEHLVQLRKKTRGFDTDCGLSYYNTDMTGIFLVEDGSKVRLPDASGQSVSLNAQIQTQLNYLDGQMKRRFEERYNLRRDPLCQQILGAPLHQTIRTGGARFMRNMGDVSVSFKCKEVLVKAANGTEECYKQIRVMNGEKIAFLDAGTRILLEKGSETLCSAANTPAIEDTKGRIVIYDPKPRVINPTGVQNLVRHEDYVEGRGIYASGVVDEWLKNAYLQSYHEKYALDFGGISANGNSRVSDQISAINEAYEITKKYDLEELVTGLDMEKIGRNCSIAVCGMVVLYAVYKILDWVVKFMMVVGSGDTEMLTSMFIACFTQFHLLAEARKKQESSVEIEMEKMGEDEREAENCD